MNVSNLQTPNAPLLTISAPDCLPIFTFMTRVPPQRQRFPQFTAVAERRNGGRKGRKEGRVYRYCLVMERGAVRTPEGMPEAFGIPIFDRLFFQMFDFLFKTLNEVNLHG